MVKVIVSGACGKMGRRIIQLAKGDSQIDLIAGLEHEGHPEVGKKIEGVKIVGDYAQIKSCDCLIDFSAPAATMAHIPHLVKFKKSVVIGTTGLTQDQQRVIQEASKTIAVVFSPNMSIGVNLLFRLVKMAGEVLKNYKVYVEEAHHIHKKDAPSGTAKKIGQILNEEGFSIKNEDIKSIREDEIVGDHRIVFESGMDKIELFHSAKTRDIFAQGAVRACRWVAGKKAGLYSMGEVLFG
ncbi:MAG: 4-hydroxy-tetrahydrodipicolinate reductase [Candidatus Omnitrophota bacterium]|nr:MAG: 4-hydroxy-tetrahydrodipicolinate reductase [Candidatus Omnitrophota bacterium]